jgi:hypothetical protein
MATLAERYWQELRPSAAAVRQDLGSPLPERRRPRRLVRRERELLRRGR